MFEEINIENIKKTIVVYYELYENGIEIGIDKHAYTKGTKQHITFIKKNNGWYQKEEEAIKPIKRINKNNTILLLETLNGNKTETNEKIYNNIDEEISEHLSTDDENYYYSTDEEKYYYSTDDE